MNFDTMELATETQKAKGLKHAECVLPLCASRDLVFGETELKGGKLGFVTECNACGHQAFRGYELTSIGTFPQTCNTTKATIKSTFTECSNEAINTHLKELNQDLSPEAIDACHLHDLDQFNGKSQSKCLIRNSALTDCVPDIVREFLKQKGLNTNVVYKNHFFEHDNLVVTLRIDESEYKRSQAQFLIEINAQPINIKEAFHKVK
ncbi:hypothetical protein A6E01_19535 (plasmid) [Vibrio breoganii]|uniref:Uncharacterized protein n=1 Tax=Vibrio breoganii TaxID=553239 RepID=A0AAN1CUC9_9VIBR|nr:hypothetical protein [Vibrio breoganii]ANO35407.1 hypothetical protein A6E01_19535 [Vibrio breoganii]